MRTAIVLGAGGARATAFHIGVLRAFTQKTGRKPDDAELLIGTSAGSTVAAAIRAGTQTESMFDELLRPPNAEERDRYREQMRGIRRTWWKRLGPAAPGLVREAFPGGRGVGLAAAGLLPAGMIPIAGWGGAGGVDELTSWPDGLWIPAVEIPDGNVVVFGRDRTDVSVRDAVQASSAVPGTFTPKEIGDDRFVDGAVASGTHAATAAGFDPDLVVISSMQSRPGYRPFRVSARGHLRDELRELRDREIKTVLVEPTADMDDLLSGYPTKNPRAGGHIADRAEDLTNRAWDRVLS